MNWHVIPISDITLRRIFANDLLKELKGLIVSDGSEDFSDFRSTVILSRLPLRWTSEDTWLESLRRAIERIAASGERFVGTAGMRGPEYALWYAGKQGMRLVVVLTAGRTDQLTERSEKLIHELGLAWEKVSFVAPLLNEEPDKETSLHIRDRVMAMLARKIYPVAIRPGGFWEAYLASSTRADYTFRIAHPSADTPPKYYLMPQSKEAEEFPWGDYLTHLTRGSHSPWPGERQADYFEALTQNSSGNPRDELATLAYIIDSGVLRGSGRLFRGGTPSISFSSRSPIELLRQKSIRRDIHARGFEPFGLAIPKRLIEALGGRPVNYGDEDCYKSLNENERHFFQNIGGKGATSKWNAEAEWRLLGDLDLKSISDDLIAICPTGNLAEKFAEGRAMKAIPLFKSSEDNDNVL